MASMMQHTRMARTPALRLLNELVGKRAQGEATGLPPEDAHARVTGQRMPDGVVAAGAAEALRPAPLPVAMARGAHSRIVIIGAGIAGITAALTLADNGVSSTIYEASERIGGRMHSDLRGYWADGQVSEWCGELIDQDHETILSLARRYGLAISDVVGAEPESSQDTLFFGGQYYTKRQAAIDFRPVYRALQRDVRAASYPTRFDSITPAGWALDHMSIWDWIESRVPGGHGSPFGQLVDVAYNIEYGAETTDQSALNLVYLLGDGAKPSNFAIFGKSDERYRISGGNERLPVAVAHDLAGRGVSIKTGRRLEAIRRLSDGSYGMTIEGSAVQVVADHVVLALPFAVLRTLDYSAAGFEELKDTAIQELGRGRNAKLQLQFTDRGWNERGGWPGISNGATYADTGYQNTWDVTRAQSGAQGILVDFTGGDVAAAFRPQAPYSDASSPAVTAYAAAFLGQLKPVLPGISDKWTGRATLSVPSLDPNLGVSYSYYRVGQYTRFGGYENVRQGNVHFCGEHCSQDFQGFMEGAASEGVRAAEEILTDLSAVA